MSTFISLVIGLIVAMAVFYGGYHSGKFHRAWLEKQAEKAAAQAKADAERLDMDRKRARHDDLKPLWEAYDKRVVDEREAFEAACTRPAFIIRMATGEDYPNFHVLKREISVTPQRQGEHHYDSNHVHHFFYAYAPPADPEFVVNYTRIQPPLSFPTAPDAERWLEACVRPEEVTWGYTPAGRPMGQVARALLPAAYIV